MKKKLQIFVSSTFVDLKDERQAAVEAILKSGNIPAGMELFTAGNESQLQTITRWIDESDIYLLILGGRYGSIEPISGLSYTEVEYDYAISQQKPYFSIVIEDSALEEKAKVVGLDAIEKDNVDKHKKFRDKVLNHTSSFFKEVKDIKLAIHETIQDFKDRFTFSGWVSGIIIEENQNLYEEIKSLRKMIEEARIETRLESNVDKIEQAEVSEFAEIEELFSQEMISSPLLSLKAGEKFTILQIIQRYKTQIVAGFNNTYDMNGFSKLFFFNVMPRLAIHGLAQSSAVPNVAYRYFSLTNKGLQFLAYLDKKNSKKVKDS